MLAELLHGGLERDGHVSCLHVALIEGLHQLGGAAVVDIPEGEQERGCPSTEEAALETEQFVTGGDEIHPSGATAERDVAGGEAHLIKVVQVKVTIAETDPGEHGVVLAVGTVRGDV